MHFGFRAIAAMLMVLTLNAHTASSIIVIFGTYIPTFIVGVAVAHSPGLVSRTPTSFLSTTIVYVFFDSIPNTHSVMAVLLATLTTYFLSKGNAKTDRPEPVSESTNSVMID